MILRQIGIVCESAIATLSEVTRVSAALQKQAMRDLGPVWDVQATVDVFDKLEDVPIGYWPILIQDDIKTPGAAGVHEDKNGQPFALVQADEGWSLTSSHELIEMLVDPFGNRVTAGQSPKPGQDRVEFLVEPCDPSEASDFAYLIDGITVSDFYTPKYFASVPNPADQYSHTGAITQPRQVLKGGYLSWHDPVSDHWFQETFFGSKPTFRDLGVFSASAGKSFRRWIYDQTEESFQVRRPKGRSLTDLRSALEAANTSKSSKATMWRAQIKEILGAKR